MLRSEEVYMSLGRASELLWDWILGSDAVGA
jgi:hypothetical protein